MAPPARMPTTAGAQLSESSQVEWNAKTTQRKESDKRPIVPETGTPRNELSRKLTRLSLRLQKASG